MFHHNFITIDGNTGAGKTSLCKKIAQDYKANLILETFAENPFLADAFGGNEAYAFRNETYFLIDRYEQHLRQVKNTNLTQSLNISDYIFTKSLLYAEVNLSKQEYQLFEKMFYIINQNLPQPELLVYIHSTVERLIKNIAKRGREFEQNSPHQYLQDVEDMYFRHFEKIKKDHRIVIIHADNLDFVANDEDYQKIVQYISQKFDYGISELRVESDEF